MKPRTDLAIRILFNLLLLAAGVAAYIYAAGGMREKAAPGVLLSPDTKGEEPDAPAAGGLDLAELENDTIRVRGKEIRLHYLRAGAVFLAVFLAGLLALGREGYRVLRRGRLPNPVPECELLPHEPEWGLPELAGALGVVLFVSSAPLAMRRLSGMDWPLDSAHAVYASLLGQAAAVLYIGLTVLHRGGDGTALGMRLAAPLRNIKRALALYAPAYPVFIGVALFSAVLWAVLRRLLEQGPPQDPLQNLAFENAGRPGFLIFLALHAVIGAPLLEEILFRGALYGAVRRHLSFLPAALLTSLLFALVHFSAEKILPILLLGFLLAWLRERTGTLTASIALHAANNGVMVLLVLALVL